MGETMTTFNPEPSAALSLVPDYPRDDQVVDQATGKITDAWALFFQNMVTAMQFIFTPEGFAMPQVAEANIANLTDPAKSLGDIIYFYDTVSGAWGFKGFVQTGVGPGPDCTPIYAWQKFTLTP